MRLLKLLVVLCALAAGQAAAGPFEEAQAAFDKNDYVTAMRLWRPLAEEGNVDAQNNLGLMYEEGMGVPQDHAMAVSWYRKAADQGSGFAQFNLGASYHNGVGVPQDHTQAYMWLDLAAANLPQQEERITAIRNRDSVAAVMTPAQIAEAQRLAREWKPKPGR